MERKDGCCRQPHPVSNARTSCWIDRSQEPLGVAGKCGPHQSTEANRAEASPPLGPSLQCLSGSLLKFFFLVFLFNILCLGFFDSLSSPSLLHAANCSSLCHLHDLFFSHKQKKKKIFLKKEKRKNWRGG